jgi:hypothetical protein
MTPTGRSGSNVAPPPAFTLLSVLFLFVFFIQVLTQQFLVRLAPYLFGAGMSASTVSEGAYIGALFTDLSAVVGIGLMVVSFYYFLRIPGLRARLLAADMMGIAFLVSLMDAARIVLSGSTFSELYGNYVWAVSSSALLAFVASSPLLTILFIESFETASGYRQGRHAYLRSLPIYLAGGAVFLVAGYSIYEGFAKQVTPFILEIAYNGGINLLGVATISSSLLVLSKTGKLTRVVAAVVGIALAVMMDYILYGNYFSLKIFELTWQTSFGAPLPASVAVVYSFFLGALVVSSIGFYIKSRSPYVLMIPVGLIVLASSLFLLNSLNIYVEGAVIGYLIFSLSTSLFETGRASYRSHIEYPCGRNL